MDCQKRIRSFCLSLQKTVWFSKPSSILPVCVLAVFIGNLLFVVTPTVDGQTPQKTQQLVQSLIQELAQADFDQRESAEQQLVEIGSPAVDLLVKELIACKPDVCSRIKRILQACTERCEEEDVFKVLAVLRVRFELPEQRIKPMLENWASQRRAEIIENWRQQGAIVIDTFKGIPNTSVGRKNQKQAKVAWPELKTRSTAELLKLILEGSLEQNKKLVFNSTKGADGFKKSVSMVLKEPVAVTIGENWRGDYSIFDFTQSQSQSVLPINALELQKRDVDNSLLVAIKGHPIISVMLTECSVAADLKEGLPRSVGVLTINGSTDAVEALKAVSDDSQAFNRVAFVNTKFGKKEALALKGVRQLTTIGLTSIDIEKDAFDGLASLGQLRRLKIDRCKFSMAEFIEYRDKKRGDVVVNFIAAKAFLGVSSNQFRGLRRADRIPLEQVEGDCVVTDVVAGEAADRAGMKNGDEILRIGGQKLENFEELRLVVAQYDVGEKVTIEIRRDGKDQTLTVTMGARKESH